MKVREVMVGSDGAQGTGQSGGGGEARVLMGCHPL